jgi:hypothetical protein
LTVESFIGDRDGKTIAQKITDVLETISIDKNKVVAATCDGASNVNSACNILEIPK